MENITFEKTLNNVTTTSPTKVDVTKGTPADATKAYDLSKAKVWNADGTYTGTNGEKKLEDAIFEVNGKKFAFVKGDLKEKDLAALREAGVEHWVTTAAADKIDVTDVSAMAEKISKETGLIVETGTSQNNAWTSKANGGADSTKVVFKSSTLTNAKDGAGLELQVGDTDDDFQKVRVTIGNMSAKGLGIDGLKNVGIADQATAGKSIDKIKSAINTVSSTRGDLGAIQNRLEHTINNLGVTTENMTAAESRIRDTDMAQEMMSYTKNNILVQAAQAMLAQANQLPQGVLQLLQ